LNKYISLFDTFLLGKLDKVDPYLNFRSLILRLLYSKEFALGDEALLTLKTAKDVLDSLGIVFWIDSGTCLGAIREKNFIRHDNDIDLGIKEKDLHRVKEIISGFMAKQFKLSTFHRDAKSGKGVVLRFVRNKIKLDIFVYYEKGDFVWNGCYTAKGELVCYVFDRVLFENLKEIDFLGLKVRVPNPVEEYLTQAYGDWQVVKKNWQYLKDPPCIRLNFLEE